MREWLIAGSAVLQLVATLSLLVLRAGRWSRGVETEVARRIGTSKAVELQSANGQPTLGELTRRVEKLENGDENRREHAELWGAVKDLRSTQNAITRRIDGLIGQGG